jgi:protein-S-isoprenylcysteine O-methyltransferase Ste14
MTRSDPVALVLALLWLALAVFGFLAAAVYRAGLEERALEATYGGQWRACCDRTWLFLPEIH